jgi:hypothetical protein
MRLFSNLYDICHKGNHKKKSIIFDFRFDLFKLLKIYFFQTQDTYFL